MFSSSLIPQSKGCSSAVAGSRMSSRRLRSSTCFCSMCSISSFWWRRRNCLPQKRQFTCSAQASRTAPPNPPLASASRASVTKSSW